MLDNDVTNRVMAGIYADPCKGLQVCDDENELLDETK